MLLDAHDHTAIDKQKANLVAAMGAGDIPAIGALHMDNAVVLAPRREIVRGQNVRRFWRNMSKQMKNVKFAPEDMELLGQHAARESGNLTFEFGEKTEAPINCKYLVVWQKVGDDWKIAAMTWSRIVKQQDGAAAAG